jgi:hypothetical protein
MSLLGDPLQPTPELNPISTRQFFARILIIPLTITCLSKAMVSAGIHAMGKSYISAIVCLIFFIATPFFTWRAWVGSSWAGIGFFAGMAVVTWIPPIYSPGLTPLLWSSLVQFIVLLLWVYLTFFDKHQIQGNQL